MFVRFLSGDTFMSVIKTNGLTKYYGKNLGIKDITLEVGEGEIFGFIGPNGAGKSTTIRLLLALIYPTEGSALIFGKDCYKHGHEIRQNIGYLPSEVFYYEKMKVGELLRYSASFYNKDCIARMHELSEIMELDLGRKIDELSFGNKKKVGIVQGLMHQPSLIILDEPTSGLDPLMQQKFFSLISDENKRGATIFFSSHILSEVQKLCSRVAIIREGSIIKTEDIKTLRKTNYKKVFVRTKKGISAFPENEGVSNVKENDSQVTFFYSGDILKLLSALSLADPEDVLIEEPTLEEIFMHYYQ